MAVEIKHQAQVDTETWPDDPAYPLGSEEWNAAHAIVMASMRLVGRTAADPGNAEEIEVATGLVLNALTLAIDKATAANVRSATANKVLTADLIEGACAPAALSDATTVSIDWDAFVYGTLTVAGNRTIGNPTNVQPGTMRVIRIVGSSATERTLSWGANYKGPLPEDTVTSTTGLLVTLIARSATVIDVTWKAVDA